MRISRRRFSKNALVAAAVAAAPAWAKRAPASAKSNETIALLSSAGDRMAFAPATFYRPYVSRRVASAETPMWIQIDLGQVHTVERIDLYPTFVGGKVSRIGFGFPVRFKVETSQSEDFRDAQVLVDHSNADVPNPDDSILRLSARPHSTRYVRLTATRLGPALKGEDCTTPDAELGEGFVLALSKIGVISNGADVALGKPVVADTAHGNPRSLQQIMRGLRPMGEGITVDNPANATDEPSWKPPMPKAKVPRAGVRLHGGIFAQALEDNTTYLLDSFTVRHMLTPFEERAGKPVLPDVRPQVPMWDTDLEGANAGRFLMGAANTLRWQDSPELRSRVAQVVDGIEACRSEDGYIMAYPEDSMFYFEHAAYTRAWVTHGLIEAGYSGNAKAFSLLRGYYDWFNQRPYLPRLLRGALQGSQGMIANTRMHHTPLGKPEDIQVIQRYFQENYWLDGLAEKNPEMIWQYPYDRPHCYLLTSLEAYMDLYLATGDERYFKAVLGGWELYRAHWAMPGGSISIKEFLEEKPGSYHLEQFKVGELCGSSFWVFLSQRLHTLQPDNERYPAEIERTIYNVSLANQDGGKGLRSFTKLIDKKWPTREINHCCEGQGTRLLGSIPEHIYSQAADGVYVNQFAPSETTWEREGHALALQMETMFPFDWSVTLRVTVSSPVSSKVRVRMPSWCAHPVDVSLNGKSFAKGQPGSYLTLDRSWHNGDTVSFTLPAKWTVQLYTGRDQLAGFRRYSITYGPILMAIVGARPSFTLPTGSTAVDLQKSLRPIAGSPLHYEIEGEPGLQCKPYWLVADEDFTCFPPLERTA